ncbi:TRAP transporter small permease [Aquibium sp. A9E412]|uniref:TRAP transporter small permease n=1 Tax=Aquibium sp. A9E412 TaxID=2976767 RepID=UPI0025B1EDFC|nr:TRAP transporter small permease [Aquibium sp. A9E412]MDN2567047.1 TRAP transporter small permease [Aquibium sp. A9E412]
MDAAGRSDDRLARAAGRAERLVRPVFVALALLATAAGAAMVALMVASVAMRHLANAPLYFTEELIGLLLTAAFFLALPLVTLNGEHVRVTLVVANLPPRGRSVAAAAAGLLGIAFCAWFVALAMPWLDFALSRGLKSEVARLLLYPWMALVPFGLVLSGLAFAIRAAAPAPAPAGR